MMRILLVALCGIVMTGCANMDNQISMGDLRQPSLQFVVDKTQPDNYSGYMAAEGNIYSCRFGIHYETKDEFSPPKAQIFAALIEKVSPTIISHDVILERFDVYYNHRLKALHIASATFGGGIIGSMAEFSASQNKDVFTFDKLLIDTNPEKERHPGENHVGCDDAHEGEYYPSEISGGHDVVVTWLKFTVDNHPYYFRTYYQFQPDNKEQIAAGVKEALQMSIKGIAPRLKL
ncbi:MAG: hypothetical protein HY016_01845 [Nitrosomonadales bacterium]|nr:hypothetical protein [Nitrosomonadales bacterium]